MRGRPGYGPSTGATEKMAPRLRHPRSLCSGDWVHGSSAGVLSGSAQEARRGWRGRGDRAMCIRGRGWCRGSRRLRCGCRGGREGPVRMIQSVSCLCAELGRKTIRYVQSPRSGWCRASSFVYERVALKNSARM